MKNGFDFLVTGSSESNSQVVATGERKLEDQLGDKSISPQPEIQGPQTQQEHLIHIENLIGKRKAARKDHESLRAGEIAYREKYAGCGSYQFADSMRQVNFLCGAVKTARKDFWIYFSRGAAPADLPNLMKIFKEILANYFGDAVGGGVSGSSTAGGAGAAGARGTRQGHQPPPSPASRPRG